MLLLDPTLTEIEDPIAILQVYAHQYYTGELAPNHKPVRSCTVEVALQAIGQMLQSMGAHDPHLDDFSNIDFHIQ